MRNDKRYNVKVGAAGCFVGVVISTVVTIVFALVFTTWLGWVTVETERVVALVVWLASIGFGGYWAARWSKSTAWPNSLTAGLLAEWYVAARILNETTLVALLDEPGPNWRRLMALALTVPVALIGGLIWTVDSKRHACVPSSEPSDVANEKLPGTVDER